MTLGAALTIENSGVGAGLDKSGIKVQKSVIATVGDGAGPTETGVDVINSDGVSIKKNQVVTTGTGIV